MNQSSAISKIEKSGVLLVFPINNKKEPDSLWTQFFPRKKLIWKWDEGSDNKVGDMWHLMKKLSDNRKVVYSKWYQGRATFFSRRLFKSMLRIRGQQIQGISKTAQLLYETLEMDSPLSTKQLKKLTDLQGKYNEPAYNRGLKELFNGLLIIAYGEVDDGAFPSLAIGATKSLYEDLWRESQELSLDEAQKTIDKYMPSNSLFRKYFERSCVRSVSTD